MKDLLNFIVSGVIGRDDYTIEETESENIVSLKVNLPKEVVGLFIGRGGGTIKAVRAILRTRAVLDKKIFNLEVVEKIT